MKPVTTLVMSACCALASACATPSPDFPKEFPPDARALGAQALKEQLSGRAFTVRQANGIGWEMNYAADSRFTIRLSTGAQGQGRWRTEDGRVCVEMEGRFPSGCSEMRAGSRQLYLKRGSTGEVVALEARS